MFSKLQITHAYSAHIETKYICSGLWRWLWILLYLFIYNWLDNCLLLNMLLIKPYLKSNNHLYFKTDYLDLTYRNTEKSNGIDWSYEGHSDVGLTYSNWCCNIAV